jgi:hypothetical protein
MNKILNVLFIVLFILVTSACSSNSNVFKTQSLKEEDIASLQVVGGLPGTNSQWL